MNNDLMFSSKSEMWETPQAFFDDLNNLFQFTLDACATPENAKCERYFTPEMDGLKQDWDGACAVEQLAQDGTKAPGNCCFTVTIPEMTVLGAIQIIPCTDAASESLRGVKEWKR